jgi:hypothetical protein
VQTLDTHFCYQDFSAEEFMSTLPLCPSLNAQPNNWLLNDMNLLIIMLDLQFHTVSGFWRPVDNEWLS